MLKFFSSRIALLLTVVSFLFCILLWMVSTPRHPYADLSAGGYTDHFSHMNAARLFCRVGIDIWRHPIKSLLPQVLPSESSTLPKDLPMTKVCEVYRVPGWDSQKPIVASWSHNPRLYPPGDMLLVAPIAIAYHYTSLTFSSANRLLILLFLIYAHFSFYFLFRIATKADPQEQKIRWMITGSVYCFSLYYTLEGFYDIAAVAPLLLVAEYLQRKQGIKALLAFSVAAFIHFRAYFFAPWGVYALWIILKEKPWLYLSKKTILQALLIAFFSLSSLGSFFLVWPTIRHLPINNPIHPESMNFHPVLLAAVGLITFMTAIWFLRKKAYLDLATLIWMVYMVFSLRQAYPWHGVILLAWLGAPIWQSVGEKSRKKILALRFVNMVLLVGFVLVIYH